MTRIDADWLKASDTQSVLALFQGAGHAAFVVGGSVRNTLLGVDVTDIDIATSATPEEGIALAESAGLHVIPTGFDHGTITIVIDEKPFEVTTFRHDIETDGRRAVVSFTADLEEDAHRRDFTINALYADASGEVIDPVGGLADLAERRIVFVGDASKRIEEDYLRSLRFFRFYAEYGDPSTGPDAEGLAAVATHLDGLEKLARERITSEMRKLLAAADPSQAVATMQICGALLRVLPGAVATPLAPLVHLEELVGCKPDWLRRLAALGGEDTTERLRMSRAEVRLHQKLRQHLEADTPLREVAWRDGADTAWSVCLIRQASIGAGIDPSVRDLIGRSSAAVFPLKAKDLMPEFTGVNLGKALARAEQYWIESDFSADRAGLLEYVKRMG